MDAITDDNIFSTPDGNLKIKNQTQIAEKNNCICYAYIDMLQYFMENHVI
jgi:hypothetical protein